MRGFTRQLITMTSIFIAVFASSLSIAGNETYQDKNDLAISGYDPVAYFTEAKAVKGKHKFSAVHNDAIYLFSSASNRDTFKVSPEKYAPQYGGYCAFGVTKNRKFGADPEAWKVVDGKLYLNLNKKVQKIWLEDVPGNIESAEEIWPEIEGASDKYLANIAG